MPHDPLRTILDRLEGVHPTATGYQARCPAHDDRRASLTVSEGDGGRALIHCHAGCPTQAVLAKIGLTEKDLFPPPEPATARRGMNIVATYDYLDRDGKLLYQAVRLKPKDFRQRRPDGRGGWKWNLQGVKLVPYRLPELVESDLDGWVFIAEGEKDVDRLASLGLVATTNAMGAGKWRKEHNEYFRQRRVAVLPDNDPPGAEHALDAARNLALFAKEVKIVRLPGLPRKGDVSDYLDAGGTVEGLMALVDAAPTFDPSKEKEPPDNGPDDDAPADADGGPLADLIPLSAAQLCHDYPTMYPPVVDGFVRERESANLVTGSKRGKTCLAMGLGLNVSSGRPWLGTFPVSQGDVLYIDCELHPNTFAKRLQAVAEGLGIAPHEYAERFHVLSLRGRLTDIMSLAPFFNRIRLGQYKLIVLDALYRLVPPEVDENSNSQMTPIYNQIDRYAQQTGAAIVVIHHSTKGSQADKSVVDVGAGASTQARATDCHIVLRQHEEEDAVVLEAAPRSFKAPVPVGLRWNYPVWTFDPFMDTTRLRSSRSRPRRTETGPTAPPPVEWTPEKFVAEFVTDEPRKKQAIMSMAALKDLSGRQAEGLLATAEEQKLIHPWKRKGSNAVLYAIREQQLYDQS